jgi:hypothetical protein
MDDWDFGGSDFDFSGDGSTSLYDSTPYDSGSTDTGSLWNASDTGSNAPWSSAGDTTYTGGTGDVPSTGSGFNWGSLVSPALQAAAGYANMSAKEKLTAEEEKNREKYYAFQKAEDEKYYQAHGQQLAKALGGYAKFAAPTGQHPFQAVANAPSPFPVGQGTVNQIQQQAQQQNPGLLAYGY